MTTPEDLEKDHLQLYKGRPDLTIKSQAEHYAVCKPGRGPTHVKAYCKGAQFLARMLQEGLITIDELSVITKQNVL